MNRLVAEAFGTFCIVFAGCGAIVVNDIHGSVTHVGVSLVFGLVVSAMIHAVGDVSGAHLNPAVTLGFVAGRRFPASAAPAYMLAQCGGGLIAALTLRGLFPEHLLLGSTRPSGSAMQSFVLEFLLTLILMVVILGVATGSKEKGVFAGVAVGGVIALEAVFAGPVSGASMNPARSLAPALLSGNPASLWIYLAAPPLGALAGVALSRIMHPRPEGASA